MFKQIESWCRDVILAHRIASNNLKIRFLDHVSRVTGKPQPSGYRFDIFETIAAVPEAPWRDLNRENNIFLTPAYFRALENAPPENMAFRYVLAYDHDTPVALAYFQIVAVGPRLHTPVRLSDQPPPETFHARLHEKLHDTPRLHILICGNILLSGEHGFAAIPDLDAARVLHVLAEAAYAIKEAEKKATPLHAILIKDFYIQPAWRLQAFKQFGYYALNTGPNMVVPIRPNWNTFADYLADMKSKYRSKVNSVLKKGRALTRKSLSYQEILEQQAILYQLYAQVVNQAQYKLFSLHPQYFAELKKQLGDNFTLETYAVENRIVGFTTRIFNGRIMEGYTHGLRYDENKQYEMYQNFLLDDVKAGIARQVAQINMGRTSIALKSSVGAVPAEIEFVLRTSGRLSNQVLKYLLNYVKPSNEHSRNPFAE